MTAITAITVQNTLGVTGIHSIPLDTVRGQIDAVVQDIGVDAVKIGMLATPEVVGVVADAIRRHKIRNVVLDPVMVATSGDRLIAPETAQVLVKELFPLASVITPISMKPPCCWAGISTALASWTRPWPICWPWARPPCCSGRAPER